MNLDRIAEAARPPPARDAASTFHMPPRGSSSARAILENSSSESSDTELAAGTRAAVEPNRPPLLDSSVFIVRAGALPVSDEGVPRV